MYFRRARNNYVNLGRLYSIPPWGTVPRYGLSKPQINSVNLGNLYAHSPTKYPSGWAYFDDGSVFMMPFGWRSHHVVEARMKIIAQFARTPTPKMQQIRATRTPMKRFIIIDKNGNDIRENMLRILARNARDGQRVSAVDSPFENVELSLDPTGTRPVSARFNDVPHLRYEHRLQNNQALETFRGTLIDGILQPNVRLGNGLRLSNKPEVLKPQIAEKSPRDLGLERQEAQVARRVRELMQLQQRLLRKIHAQNKQPYQGKQGDIQRQQTHESTSTDARVESDSKITDTKARERALKQQGELLWYKRKTWLLEQKLAQATATSPPRHRSSNPEMVVQERDRDVCEETGPSQEAIPDTLYTDPDGDQLSDYNFTNPSPPAALENLRSRIRLPTRKTMRANRGSGNR